MLAVDIGGTYTRYSLNGKTRILKTAEIDFVTVLEQLIEKHRPEKVAVSFAGQVKDKKIVSSPNTVFENIDLSYLEKKYSVRLILENDMNCAVLAESEYWGSGNIVALYSGTGLGAGILDNGKIVKGMAFGGEIGHIPYKESPFMCKCGKNNCIELYASGGGIEKWNGYYGLGGLKSEKIKKMYIEAFMYALGVVFSLFDPETVVIGGGVITHNRWLLDEMLKLKNRYVPGFNTGKIRMTYINNASLRGAEILLKDVK